MNKQRSIRKLAWVVTLAAMLALSSCTAPGDSAAAPAELPVSPAAQPAPAPPAKAALPAPAPTPAPKSVPTAPSSGPGATQVPPDQQPGGDPGRACRIDSDCAMKDAGSCCGFRPVCVNKDTPTFPEKVKASCAKDGRVGICGFAPIEGCQCVAGKCKGVLMMENSVPLQ